METVVVVAVGVASRTGDFPVVVEEEVVEEVVVEEVVVAITTANGEAHLLHFQQPLLSLPKGHINFGRVQEKRLFFIYVLGEGIVLLSFIFFFFFFLNMLLPSFMDCVQQLTTLSDYLRV